MTKEEQAAHMMRWAEEQGFDADTKIACLQFAVEIFRVLEEAKAKEQDQ
jgi:hypothetical protein